jgi:hypothetical protein
LDSWTYRRMPMAGQGIHYDIEGKSGPLSFADALNCLQREPRFRQFLTDVLAASDFAAFRWETPPISVARVTRPFEFVMIDAPYLDVAAEPDVFARYFEQQPSDSVVMVVPNLSRTAQLVVPRELGTRLDCYAHFAAFLRGAPTPQVHQLWQSVASTALGALSARPLWTSTAGAGVAWLHVRIENTPKYYSYRPYAHEA